MVRHCVSLLLFTASNGLVLDAYGDDDIFVVYPPQHTKSFFSGSGATAGAFLKFRKPHDSDDLGFLAKLFGALTLGSLHHFLRKRSRGSIMLTGKPKRSTKTVLSSA